MLVGYVRSEDPVIITEASRSFEEAGCARTLIDAADLPRGKVVTEPLKALLKTLKPDDTLTLIRLDQLARMPLLISVLVALMNAGISVRSLRDGFSTDTPQVRETLAVLSRYMPAQQCESETKPRGRSRALSDTALAEARTMIEERGMPIADVAAAMGVSRATIYRYLGSGRELRQLADAAKTTQVQRRLAG